MRKKDFAGSKELTCHGVAEDFFASVRTGSTAGHTTTANPQMSQFVQKGKQACCRRISRVDEDDGCDWIADGKASELCNVQRPMRIVVDDSAAHHQNTNSFSGFDQLAVVDLPRPLSSFNLHAKHSAYVFDDETNGVRWSEATHERQRIGALIIQILQVPRLALQSEADGIQKIDARTRGLHPTNGP